MIFARLGGGFGIFWIEKMDGSPASGVGVAAVKGGVVLKRERENWLVYYFLHVGKERLRVLTNEITLC